MNPASKQVKSTLFKRSMDQYAPDMLFINASSIAFVEPVISGSKIEIIIKQADTQGTNILLPPAEPKKQPASLIKKQGIIESFRMND